MTFQKTVNFEQGFGVPGDIHLDSPIRAESLVVDSKGAQKNHYGYAYTKDASTNIAQVGGAIGAGKVFAGIMVNSKEAALYGGATGTLEPTLAIPDNSQADFAVMADIVVQVSTACKIGDFVVYDETTGALSTVADSSSLGGKKLVPNAVVYRYPVTSESGGLTVVRLTN
ncbi:structural cement protein Gp24 [Testudinibacter sp. P80/BLE/0925]